MLSDEGVLRTRPTLRWLTPGMCRRVHDASLEILARTGVAVHLPEAVDLLAGAGAWVRGAERVCIPAALVEDALHRAPSRITVYDRQGRLALRLEPGRVHYGTGTDTPFVIDGRSGARRPARLADVGAMARLCDGLDQIDFVGCMGGAAASEITPLLSDRHNFATLLRNTVKPLLFTAWSEAGLADIHRMAVAACGGDAAEFRRRPFIIHYAEPVSPLVHPAESCRKLLFCARHGIPVTYTSGTLMGGTVPVTVAGALAQSNAEFLSGLVMAQLAAPGAPVIYGGINTPLDMQTGVNIYSGPDSYLNHIAVREMAGYYGLADFNTGGCSDAKQLDLQAAAEAGLSILQTGLAGSNLIHDVGYLESGLTACWEMVVLADELIAQVRHMLAGAPWDRDHLAVDAVNDVGPGGSFVDHAHTMDHFRGIWYPTTFDRRTHEAWQQAGGQPLQARLRERANDLVDRTPRHPLPPGVEDVVGEVLAG